jgi:hypothetical protein
MLSKPQDKKYWRRWAAVVRANDWRMLGGRLAPTARLDISEAHCKVLAAARQLAAAEAKGLAPEHLRHGCHIVALGRDKSHPKFTNREFDDLLNLWGDERAIRGLLIEPTDLAAAIHASNPQLKARERTLLVIRRDFIESYVAQISMTMFGTRDWQSLPDEDLESLFHIVLDRPNARKVGSSRCDDRTAQRAVPTNEIEVDPENCPF